NPLLLPYHVVPQNLPFSDLLLLPRRVRLPTLLATKTISITDNSPANFSLDYTPLTHPDLFSTPPSPSTASSPSSTTLSSVTASRSRPLPPPATPSTLYGTQVRPPPTPALTMSFCSPFCLLFFHCYYSKVFQSLLKREREKRTFG
ncbi:hypothetical protein V8G54_001820, partial [Vigna mungo]